MQQETKEKLVTPKMMLESMMGIYGKKNIDIFDIESRINASKAFDVRLCESDIGTSDVVTNTGAGTSSPSSNKEKDEVAIVQPSKPERIAISEKNKKNEYAGIVDAGNGDSYKTSYLH